MMMTMMMKMNSRRMEMNEDGKKKGEKKEETRLKESQPTCRRPRSTLPAIVNTWRPTIAKLIHCDRLFAIRALLYYLLFLSFFTMIVRKINVEPICTFFFINECNGITTILLFFISSPRAKNKQTNKKKTN